MSSDMAISGVAAFGLHDVVASSEGNDKESGFFFADTLLPGRPFGPILTGIQSKAERIHSGFPWPPEAQLQPGRPLRRAPIACVWRSLVEAGEEQARWKIGEGISFPLARILAAHVKGLIEDNGENGTSPVVAIPNDLDELGQENLLYELDRMGVASARLIWRPVASALAWLELAGEDIVPQRLKTEDFIIVLHMGPDAVEFTSFRLKVEEYENSLYVLPRRKRPIVASELCGFDWACAALEGLSFIPPEGTSEFWQAFASFPEIWQCIADLPWQVDELPRIWGLCQSWGFWNPTREDLVEALRSVHCGPSTMLQKVIGESCKLSGTTPSELTWPERLQQTLLEALEKAPEGKLVGLIMDGPLVMSTAPSWLQACFPQLEHRGLDTSGSHGTPELGRLWCSPGNIAIARGASIFGHRLLTGEPTYLDTLPQLSLLAKRERALALFPLVDAQDVRGGEQYEKTIERQFVIEGNQSNLDVILCRGVPDPEWLVPAPANEQLDRQVCNSAAGLTLGASSMARHLVRARYSSQTALSYLANRQVHELSFAEQNQMTKLMQQMGIISAALKDLCSEHGSAMTEYVEYFETLYKGGNGESVQSPKTHLPFKKVSSIFPLPAPRTMPVNINVRISPVSGRAKMEVVPEDTSFLRGRHVFVDYATMEDLKELPSVGQGWPSLEEMVPHSDQSIWNAYRRAAEHFLNATAGSGLYDPLLDRIYYALKSRPFLNNYGVSFFMLNQQGSDGCDTSSNVVGIISRGIAKHAESLMSSTVVGRRGARQAGEIRLPADRRRQLLRLIVRGSWLMGATPEALRRPMRYVLQDRLAGLTWSRVVDAAGRAFTTTEDMFMLNQAVVRRIGQGHFPMPSINAVCRTLMYWPNGQDALDADIVCTLLHKTCEMLDEHAGVNRYKRKFFQGLRLLLYLLRYRKREATFIEKDSRSAQELLERLDLYEHGLKRVLKGARCSTAVGIINGIKDFVNFAGTSAILGLLTAMAEEKGEEDEDVEDTE